MTNSEWTAIEAWEERMFEFYNRSPVELAREREECEARAFECYIDTLEAQNGRDV